MFKIGTKMGMLEARCESLEAQNKEYAAEIQFLRKQRQDLLEELERTKASCQTQCCQHKSDEYYTAKLAYILLMFGNTSRKTHLIG